MLHKQFVWSKKKPAIASSKLFPAAENATTAFLSYSAPQPV